MKLREAREDEDSDDDDYIDTKNAPDADDPFSEAHRYLYYPTDKALGHLFREIDEFKFVEAWETIAKRHQSNGPTHLLKRVVTYLLEKAHLDEILKWSDFTNHLMISYENNMHDLAVDYAARRDEPLEEVEVFIGYIMGRESHRQTKGQRESSDTLRSEVNRLVSHIVAAIRHGSENRVVEEGNYDGYTLERAIMAAMHSLTSRMDGVSSRSFGWLAVGVALKELAKRGIQSRAQESVEIALSRAFAGIRV
ncbi:hypothetical protein ABW19_dt0202233 [Dactylella cylindrospora]|nr:hypothetical protein ABW19_dt0202233 [Dactylella cylindrospora]